MTDDFAVIAIEIAQHPDPTKKKLQLKFSTNLLFFGNRGRSLLGDGDFKERSPFECKIASGSNRPQSSLESRGLSLESNFSKL